MRRRIDERPLACAECGRTVERGERGWRAYLASENDDDFGPETVVAYCRKCAEREFGGDGR